MEEKGCFSLVIFFQFGVSVYSSSHPIQNASKVRKADSTR